MKTYIIPIITIALFISSCVKDGNYNAPNYTELQQSGKTKAELFDGNRLSYSQLRAKATALITEYTENDAFEGYVVSSDEGGNFYKKIYVQAPDKSGTIAIAIEKKGLYADFPLGTKVQIRLKGTTFWYNSRYALIEIGYGSGVTTGGNTKISNLPPSMIDQVVINTSEKKEISELTTSFGDIKNLNKNENTNRLITLKNVQFESSAVGQTFYKTTDQYNTSYKLEDNLGGSVVFLTSSYATYAQELIPSGKLIITGILTKYNSTYQFYINTLDDIQKTN